MASSPLCNHGYCGLTVPAPSPLHPACIRPNHRTGHLYLFCTENRRRSQKPRYQDNGVPAFRTEKSKEKQRERERGREKERVREKKRERARERERKGEWERGREREREREGE